MSTSRKTCTSYRRDDAESRQHVANDWESKVIEKERYKLWACLFNMDHKMLSLVEKSIQSKSKTKDINLNKFLPEAKSK
jgi:hypothetical protein